MRRLHRRPLSWICVFTLLFLAMCIPTPANAGNPCTAASPYDTVPDADALQSCLDQGGQITLIPDASPGYLIDHPLFIGIPGTELTTTTGSGHARLIATYAFFTTRYTSYPQYGRGYPNPMLTGLASASPYYVRNIHFEGLKNVSGVYRDTGTGNMEWSVNATMWGHDFVVDAVESTNTFLGAGMQAECNHCQILNSSFTWNGRPQREPGWDPNGDGLYVGDGLTVWKCYGGSIRDNHLLENTDVDLVIGEGSSCTVERNQIENQSVHTIAGLQIGWFTDSGDHAGSMYTNNDIVSGYNQMAFGIIVGDSPWYSPWDLVHPHITHAGSVVGNRVHGAVVGLAVAGIGGGTVADNTVWGSQGDFGFPKASGGGPNSFCSLSGDYAAFNWGTASIQGGWQPWYFEGGVPCGAWNTATPMPDPNDPGILLPDGSRGAGQYVTSQDGRYHLVYQGDGNLVLYDQNWNGIWANMKFSSNPLYLYMQSDGNLITHDASGDTWSSRTGGHPGAYLDVQNDGNIVIYDRYHNSVSCRYDWTW